MSAQGHSFAKHSPKIVAALALVSLAAGGVVAATLTDDSSVNSGVSSSSSSLEEVADAGSNLATRTFTTTYPLPKDHTNTMVINLTLKDEVITDLSITNTVQDSKSKDYHDKFNNEIVDLVIGKKIADLSYSTVSGASLTSAAFFAALN